MCQHGSPRPLDDGLGTGRLKAKGRRVPLVRGEGGGGLRGRQAWWRNCIDGLRAEGAAHAKAEGQGGGSGRRRDESEGVALADLHVRRATGGNIRSGAPAPI